MTQYEEKNGRKKIIGKIFEKLIYVHSFSEIYWIATKFHLELSTLYQVKNIFTTNWDTFFEDKCAAIPFVTSEDFALWDLPERKVFKIHGSVSNVGSIVATEEDYKNNNEKIKDELIGNHLKVSLATQTFVFCGYSFQDYDFLNLLEILKEELREFSPKLYLITISKKIDKEKLKKYNIIPIYTDATFFIHSLKNELIKKNLLLPDDNLETVMMAKDYLNENHNKLFSDNLSLKYPSSLYSLAYQDGLKHSFERMIQRFNTGEYSNPEYLDKFIKNYKILSSRYYDDDHYWNAAYIEGYINGLIFIKSQEKDKIGDIPLYYLYKKPLNIDYNEFLEILEMKTYHHEKSSRFAEKIVKIGVSGKDGVNLHHSLTL